MINKEDNLELIRRKLSALYEIRFDLMTEKLKNDKISTVNLSKIVLNAKKNANDERVSKELDKIFDEFMPNKTMISDRKEVVQKTHDEIMSLEDMIRDSKLSDSVQNGTSKVLTDRTKRSSMIEFDGFQN